MTPADTRPGHPAVLHGYGPLTWPQATALLDGAQCVWTDLAGLHLEPAPSDAPLATHLWAWWPDGHCARIRLDHQRHYTAILHPHDTTAAEPASPPTVTEDVRAILRHDAPLWGDHDTQAGPLPPQLRNYAWDLLEIPGPTPVTFIRATTAT